MFCFDLKSHPAGWLFYYSIFYIVRKGFIKAHVDCISSVLFAI